MERKINEFFASQTMPQDCAERIEATLSHPAPRRRNHLRPIAAAAAMLLVLCLGKIPAVRVYAGELYDRFVHALAPELEDRVGQVEENQAVMFNNAQITYNTDGDGVTYPLISWTEENNFCEVRNGRLYFIANGENIDITDRCSMEVPYLYVAEDNAGNLHYLAVGGTPEDYGMLEYIPAPADMVTDLWFSEYGEYHDGVMPPWMIRAKAEILAMVECRGGSRPSPTV